MKRFLAAAIAVGAPASAAAQEGETVRIRDLTTTPRTYLGREIRLDAAVGCVDTPAGGFTCLAQVGGQMLKVESSVLGPKTPLGVTERLLGDCKGTANLTRPGCQFLVRLKATTAYKEFVETPAGSVPITIVVSPRIEMFLKR